MHKSLKYSLLKQQQLADNKQSVNVIVKLQKSRIAGCIKQWGWRDLNSHDLLRSTDFKSAASTNSATPPGVDVDAFQQRLIYHTASTLGVQFNFVSNSKNLQA